MEHFSEQPLADFVRGVSTPDITKAIKAHLDSACSTCRTTHDVWSRLRRLATQEEAYTPPESVVRMAKFAFTCQAAQKTQELTPTNWTIATLVYNSFAQPLPAGVRSSGALSVWQVVYEAEGLAVDLRFGRRSQSKAVHVVGQVLDKQAARALGDNTTVELSTKRDQLIATAPVTNLGEFHLEFEAEDQMWLSIRAAGRTTVRIPLANPA